MQTPFKVAGDIRLMTVSQRQFSAAVELSTTRINELINEGILVRDPSTEQGRLMLLESLQNFYLSRGNKSDGVDFWKERAQHEKVKRELSELKLAKERGEVYDAEEIEQSVIEFTTILRDSLFGLGHKLAARLVGKSAAEICAEIDAEVTLALNEFAESANETMARLNGGNGGAAENTPADVG